MISDHQAIHDGQRCCSIALLIALDAETSLMTRARLSRNDSSSAAFIGQWAVMTEIGHAAILSHAACFSVHRKIRHPVLDPFFRRDQKLISSVT